MSRLSRAYDALREAAFVEHSIPAEAKLADALRAYVKECQETLRASVGDALLRLSDEAQEANDHHMRVVIRLVEERLYPILRRGTE